MNEAAAPEGGASRPETGYFAGGSAVSPEELESQVERIIASRTFAKSGRLQDFLRYTVAKIKLGRGEEVKEYLIAVEVFGRRPDFDPRFDSIVRVQASRLREKLATYYETEGQSDPIVVTLPRGAYIPSCERRAVSRPKPSPRFGRWGAAIALACAVISGVVFLHMRARGARTPVLTRVTSDGGFSGYPALSRDGRWIAFASDRGGRGHLGIWAGPVSDGSLARQVTDHEANDYEPAFSPDGRHIVYRSDREGGGIYIVPTAGGDPKLLAKDGRRPRFSPDGRLVVYWQRDETWGPGRIYTVAPTGGEPTRLVPDFADAHYPVWSPDGAEVLFCGTRNPEQGPGAAHDWWVLSFSSGRVRKTGAVESLTPEGTGRRLAGLSGDLLGIPGGWRDGSIVFSTRLGDSENIWEAAITADRRVSPNPRRLTFGASMDAQAFVSDRTVAFFSGAFDINVFTTPLERDGASRDGARIVTDDAGLFALSPSVSEDGGRISFISTRSGSRDVWSKNLETGREERLTATSGIEEGYTCLTADGSHVAYRVIEASNQAIYVVDTKGGAARKICANCGLPTGWSHDGRYLLYEPGSSIPGIGMLDTRTGAAREIAVHATYKLRGARFSPDDRWIAFYAETDARGRKIFVARVQHDRLPGESEWIPITGGSGVDVDPTWSLDGRVLYFITEREGFRCIWGQRLDAVTRQPAGAPFAVEDFHSGGRSLLMTFRADPRQIGLSASRSGLFYSVEQLHGNVWVMELP